MIDRYSTIDSYLLLITYRSVTLYLAQCSPNPPCLPSFPLPYQEKTPGLRTIMIIIIIIVNKFFRENLISTAISCCFKRRV